MDGLSGPNRPRALYLSHAPAAVYDLIRCTADGIAVPLLLETDTDAERLRLLPDADVVIVAAYRLSAAMIETAPRLRLVHHQGVGYHDTVDLPALARTGARLAVTPAGTTIGVAEHTVLLALAVLRRLAFLDAELRQGRWHINTLRSEARELAGKTIGYVGMGRIGQATARRFRPFDTRGLYFDPKVRLTPDLEAELGLTAVDFDTLLTEADIITLHLPLTDENHHLIGADAIARMKRDAIVINTARGPIVDEAALTRALLDGRIGGAGLDVFEREPPDPGSALHGLRNVVLTPHVSAATRDAFEQKMAAVFANIARWSRGEPLENEVALAPWRTPTSAPAAAAGA